MFKGWEWIWLGSLITFGMGFMASHWESGFSFWVALWEEVLTVLEQCVNGQWSSYQSIAVLTQSPMSIRFIENMNIQR